MKEKLFDREALLEYVKEVYDTDPDYPFPNDFDSAVLRHQNNKKWYALIMNIAKKHIGIGGDETVDVINIKCDQNMIGSLIRKPGYFPAYHMNKLNWITVILDGSVPKDELAMLLDISFDMTAKKTRGKKNADTQSDDK